MITQGLALAAAALMFTGPVPADDPSPSPEPDPITITLTPEQSKRVCEQRIPRLLDRIDRATDRINGDADTPGSTAFANKRADALRAEGKEDAAELIEERAQRRSGRVELLAELREKVVAFDAEHCK
jgi:hypothetical protein